MTRNLLLAAFILAAPLLLKAQKIDSTNLVALQRHEARLSQYFDSLKSLRSLEARISLNKHIVEEFDKTLENKASHHYAFDSLKIGDIRSNDGLIRIFTWNVPLKFGEHKYFGYIQHYDKKADTTYLYQLQDQELQDKPHEYQEYTPSNWYGALYYEIIEEKDRGEKIYTLLGYDLNNALSSCKFIDILAFKNNEPVFGAPVFAYQNKNPYRIIFEYSARVSMTLTYNKNMKMITFDQLVPFEPSMKDNYQFYGPAGSLYNGFEFDKGQWIFRADIDARNL